MTLKTPYKVMSKIQIQRADAQLIERDINLSQVVQDAIVDHLVSTLGVATDEPSALALIQRWRIRTIWIDEPV